MAKIIQINGENNEFYSQTFYPPHLIFTLLLALLVFTGCQVESDDSGNSEPAAKISYTVKFDTNGGEGKLPGDLTATVGEEFTLPAAKLTKTGYDFKGWYATADGTGTTYETGAKAKDLSKENGATVTLYAKWVLQGSWSINYILNGGTNADENPESYNVETETITLKPAVKSGYIFDGWYKEDSFATQVPKITKGSTGNITLYAKWTKTYTVTFDANGGSGAMNPQIFTYGEPQNLSPNEFTMENKDFLGWATSAGVGVSYSDKAKITVTGNITLYAKYGMTAANAAETIANLTEEGTHAVTVAGEISADDLTKVAKAISGLAENVNVILDLSGATGLTEIPDFAFHKEERWNMYALVGIVLPQSVASIGESAFSWTQISEIVIPDSVTEIGISAFDTCEELKSVKIGAKVAKIGNLAFSDTALTSIEIPDSVSSVGTQIFQGCETLKDVTIGKGLTSISSSMFISCSALEEIVIPDGIKSIERCAFEMCNTLKTITIPASVTLIEEYAIDDCASLADVHYGGTVAEWNALKDDGKISSTGNNALFNATIHCTNGDITPTTGA